MSSAAGFRAFPPIGSGIKRRRVALQLPCAVGPGSARGVRANAFIRVGSDGKITLVMPQVEMGQGVYTSIAMSHGGGAGRRLRQVVLEHAPPDEKHYANPAFGVQATGNSNSIRAFWKPLRTSRQPPGQCWSRLQRNNGAWIPRPARPPTAR